MNQKRHVEGDTSDLDKPTPPGGPNRTDAPDGPFSPGKPAQDPGPEVERVTKRTDAPGEAVEHPDADAEQSEAGETVQERNAEESEYGEPSQ